MTLRPTKAWVGVVERERDESWVGGSAEQIDELRGEGDEVA